MRASVTRSVALGAIILSHVFAIGMLELCLAPPRTARRTEIPPLMITFVEETAPERLRGEASPRPRLEKQENTPLVAPTIHSNGDATGAITDWQSEASAAARDAVRRETEAGAQREFSHRFPVPAAPDAAGVFGLEKKNRRAGLVEGGENFWVTDDCYYDFPRTAPLTHAAGEFQLLTPVCKPPPTGGGADMFKDVTPGYLKREPVLQSRVFTSR
jgi:hypothetical protein